MYLPHWYSVFLRYTPKDGEPSYSTDNGVVYVHDSDGGGGGSSSFVAPAVRIYADAGKWDNGRFIPIGDVELEDLSGDPGVSFYYHVRDSAGNTYGLLPTEYSFGEGSAELQYVFVYADADPKDDPLTAWCPVGMARETWLAAVSNFRAAHPDTEDYSELLGTLN